jgi:hypothetical protein
METSEYARGAQGVDRALPKSLPKSYTKEAMATSILPRQEGSHQEGVSKTTRGWFLSKKYTTQKLLVLKKNNNEWRMCCNTLGV